MYNLAQHLASYGVSTCHDPFRGIQVLEDVFFRHIQGLVGYIFVLLCSDYPQVLVLEKRVHGL